MCLHTAFFWGGARWWKIFASNVQRYYLKFILFDDLHKRCCFSVISWAWAKEWVPILLCLSCYLTRPWLWSTAHSRPAWSPDVPLDVSPAGVAAVGPLLLFRTQELGVVSRYVTLRCVALRCDLTPSPAGLLSLFRNRSAEFALGVMVAQGVCVEQIICVTVTAAVP